VLTLVTDVFLTINYNIVFTVNVGATYGNGTYFAVEAKKSLQYSNPDVNGHRHMYWCRVLTGEYTQGCTDMVAAPVKTTGTYHLYNSVVDNVKSHPACLLFLKMDTLTLNT
jgi:poly [ADP-ribose] polymerase 10/14/15